MIGEQLPIVPAVETLVYAILGGICRPDEAGVEHEWIGRVDYDFSRYGTGGHLRGQILRTRASRVSGKIIRGLPDPAASEYRSSAHIGADVHYVGVPRVAHGNIDAAGHNRATVSGNVKEARGAEGRPNG